MATTEQVPLLSPGVEEGENSTLSAPQRPDGIMEVFAPRAPKRLSCL